MILIGFMNILITRSKPPNTVPHRSQMSFLILNMNRYFGKEGLVHDTITKKEVFPVHRAASKQRVLERNISHGL